MTGKDGTVSIPCLVIEPMREFVRYVELEGTGFYEFTSKGKAYVRVKADVYDDALAAARSLPHSESVFLADDEARIVQANPDGNERGSGV